LARKSSGGLAGRVRTIAQSSNPTSSWATHNFGGEGISAAANVGATAVLEVNAPVIDHPGSAKTIIDRVLVIQPMRRWRDRLCDRADLIVTPTARILPPGTRPEKVVELEWGADTDRFRPDASGPLPFTRPFGTVAVFAGAFRAWHGAIHLVRAIRELRRRHVDDVAAVFIGDGPQLSTVRADAAGLDGVIFTGAVEHDRMPACLAAADIGIAPFDVDAHRPLSLGFYWSPLKMFEYMSVGLPVIAPAVDRIGALIQHEREGFLYDPGKADALANAIATLKDPALRVRLGAAARERAVREYSWKAHCRALEAAILGHSTRPLRGLAHGRPLTGRGD
jgi:glycosyltransferase involved in cell wall biosynthesis